MLQNAKLFLIVLFMVMVTHVPQLWAVEEALSQNAMVSTTEWVDEQNRQEMTDKVTAFLLKEEVRGQLESSGVSVQEARDRIASLSESELRHLASEVDKAQYGGSVGGVLIIVLLVVLIIYLVKRI